MLWDTVSVGIEDAGINPVPQSAESLVEPDQDRTVVPGGKLGDVLHQDRGGPEALHHGHEAVPQRGTWVVLGSLPRTNQASDLRAAGAGEWLARRTTRDKVH